MNKNTIVIAYSGGTYGTYLEWALTTLTTDIPIQSPLTNRTNSENFKGNQLMDLPGWADYVKSNNNYLFARLHPKSNQDHLLTENLNTILKNTNKLIYLYPDHQSMLLSINNFYSKTGRNWWEKQFSRVTPPDTIYNNWPVSRDTPLDQLPDWVRREFLSHYLMPSWFDLNEWYHLDRWSHADCINITVGQLLYNFEETILKIKDHCNLTFKKSISELAHIHITMLAAQKDLDQDWLVKEIVYTTINNIGFDWSDYHLPIPSQAWIQWQLRNLGYEIECNKLDKFPTNNVQLMNLLYKVN